MPSNGPELDIIPEPPKVKSDYSYRGPQEVHVSPVGTPLDQRLAEAHEITRQHNAGNHDSCTPETCYVVRVWGHSQP